MEQMHPPARRLEDVLRPVRRVGNGQGAPASFIGKLGSATVLVVRHDFGARGVELEVVGEATDRELEELRAVAQTDEQTSVSIARAGSRRR